jgi:tRNA threonylcarbamoyladenosine biosynthesis protein TsaB
MKVMAVDTSSSMASVAILDKDQLLGEYSINSNKKHSQILMPMIQGIMNNLDIRPEEIDLFGVSTGPGSFTGLRIGITVIKAMAYALKKPVVGVPSLEALAYNLSMSQRHICPIMDARNNQVYTALYKWDGANIKEVTKCMGIPIQELVKLVKDLRVKTIFVGDGVTIHREYLCSQLGDYSEFAPPNLLLQNAASVAYAAKVRADQGILGTSFELVPFYLRKSQAEREYEKKMKVEKAES